MAKRGNGEGSITRHKKSGLYMARYTVQTADGPKRKTIYGKKREVVADKLAKALANRSDGLVYDDGNLTIEGYLTRWLKDSVQGTIRNSTFVRYKGIVVNHIVPALGNVKLAKLTPFHVRCLYRDKLDAGLSPRSVNYIHVTLHKALKQAVLDGLIPRNVSEAVRAPQMHRNEVTPLSPEQVRALLQAASGDRLEALWTVALHTGLRRGELLALRWTDVELEAGRLAIRRSLAADGSFNPPKRKSSKRTVRLTNAAVEALKTHKAAQNEERLKLGSLWEDHWLIFPNQIGKPMNAGNLYHRDWRSLLKRSELKPLLYVPHATPHVCHDAAPPECEPEDCPGGSRPLYDHSDDGHLLTRHARHAERSHRRLGESLFLSGAFPILMPYWLTLHFLVFYLWSAPLPLYGYPAMYHPG
jgi:integrase